LAQVRQNMLSLLSHIAHMQVREPYELETQKQLLSAEILHDVYVSSVRHLRQPMPQEPKTERPNELSLEEMIPYHEWKVARDQYYESLLFAGMYRALFYMDRCLGGQEHTREPYAVPTGYRPHRLVRVEGNPKMSWHEFCSHCMPDYAMFKAILQSVGHADAHSTALETFNTLAESDVLNDIKDEFAELAEAERSPQRRR
jgi:hypothetical protein